MYSKGKDQSGKVANPARGQLKMQIPEWSLLPIGFYTVLLWSSSNLTINTLTSGDIVSDLECFRKWDSLSILLNRLIFFVMLYVQYLYTAGTFNMSTS